MRISSLIFVVFVYLISGFSFADELINQEVNLLQSIADESEKGADGRVIVGDDPDWLFLRSELSHVAKGRFWEKNWKDVSVAGEDPLPIFLSLNEKLKSLGVQFVYVPVPPKISIYPDKLTKRISPKDKIINAGPFLDKLRMGGIKVIDIEPLLIKERRSNGSQSYCMTDSHPSPWTCELIAEQVAQEIRGHDWAEDFSKKSKLNFIRSQSIKLGIKGDLIPDEDRDDWKSESLEVVRAGIRGEVGIESVSPDDSASPVIVLGDSHTLIFHEGGDMLMTRAGTVDHLQEKIGFKVFLAASRGSSSQALRQIYKGPGFWKGKKVLVWISSVRELTQERRWLKLPRLPR
ncbi:MAG TPA: hypothetical protein EYG40_11875 [Verrucomicrobia bacterium]|nr:hypothetical protein [Verrucomicrobiales bacterium]HIL55717.1 hypothetical protein [Verrucomicrobiota bacterium]